MQKMQQYDLSVSQNSVTRDHDLAIACWKIRRVVLLSEHAWQHSTIVRILSSGIYSQRCNCLNKQHIPTQELVDAVPGREWSSRRVLAMGTSLAAW